MDWDDLGRLMRGRTLFRLDTVLGAKLVPLLYVLGLAALLLWCISHLFWSFGSNFGTGLWGILEIVVFAPLGVVALRILCDALLVYFRANSTGEAATRRSRSSLLDEVRDAIRDLAEREEAEDVVDRAAATLDDDDDLDLTVAAGLGDEEPGVPPPSRASKEASPRPVRRTAKRRVRTPREPL